MTQSQLLMTLGKMFFKNMGGGVCVYFPTKYPYYFMTPRKAGLDNLVEQEHHMRVPTLCCGVPDRG